MSTFVLTVLVFMIVISLHELGHFIMAKAIGVKVLEFAVGFGPAVLKKQAGETLYSLRIFPLGGYCKLEGEETASPDDKRSFVNQSPAKRFLVLVAGAAFNMILGFILFMVIGFMLGSNSTTEISSVVENSYLAETEVREGDRIKRINGKKISVYEDISMAMSGVTAESLVALELERDGESFNVTVKPSESSTKILYRENDALITTTVNGVETSEIAEYTAQDVPAEIIGTTQESTGYIIGFVPGYEDITALNIIPYSADYTWYVVRSVYGALADLITGRLGLENLSGPVGVAAVVSDVVSTGGSALSINILYLLAMLTINLGVFNLLPIPALDGGKILFVIIEIIRRKPVPPEKEALVHVAGMMLLLVLAVVVAVKDVITLL